LAPRTTLSSIGPSCLHGPHHGAQKSTMTGWSNEASTTSAMKFAVVTSWTGAAAPAPASPPPIKGSSAIEYSPGNPCQNMAAWRRDDKRRKTAVIASSAATEQSPAGDRQTAGDCFAAPAMPALFMGPERRDR